MEQYKHSETSFRLSTIILHAFLVWTAIYIKIKKHEIQQPYLINLSNKFKAGMLEVLGSHCWGFFCVYVDFIKTEKLTCWK